MKKKKRRKELWPGYIAAAAFALAAILLFVKTSKGPAEETGAAASSPRETAAAGYVYNALPDISVKYELSPSDVSGGGADLMPAYTSDDGTATSLWATLNGDFSGMAGRLKYRVGDGDDWSDWTLEPRTCAADSVESVAFRIDGELGTYYDIFYSTLKENVWSEWAKNGETCGQTGDGRGIEGLRASVVKKEPGVKTFASGAAENGPMVALSFDDGPNPSVTSGILELLKENDASATFFMVGKNAAKFPSTVQAVIDAGCEIGNHTYEHVSMKKISPEEFESTVSRTNDTVFDICGVRPVLMRPCGGAKNDAGMEVLRTLDMTAVLWSLDTLDWKTRNAASTVSAVLDHVEDGDIILMHDLYATTLEACRTIIPQLRARGYSVVTVSQLAAARGGYLPGQCVNAFKK